VPAFLDDDALESHSMPVLDEDSARVLPTRKAAFDRASEGARSLSRSHDPDPAAVAGERKDEGLIAEAESLGGDLVEPSREKKVRIGGLEPGIEDRARLPPQRFRHDPTSIPGGQSRARLLESGETI
jgi:hypothetical protein